MAQLTCIIVTPEETALEQEADFVALPLFDGEAGVAPGHSPLIGRLGFGEMRVRQGDTVERFYVDGGFVQVRGNVVSVLTNRATLAANVDADQAREQLKQANQLKANTPELMEARDRQISQARGQLWVTRS
ncbi:MAG: ATP synthase F1 subunit epsilon [Planctomycetaceae bacterium]|jgi:F-type H+-transporting ATPase subunit epsilon|nr:ATP synthase F1 subunit epsilon [Planctomycetaceae bacterium]MCP4811520.1 ATP synthase F1 subunit epsilon [Planctomycetaceae bacterium]MEC9002108.1 ATP synthase F1 subunit epsilon [Planctomycetota bacterium]